MQIRFFRIKMKIRGHVIFLPFDPINIINRMQPISPNFLSYYINGHKVITLVVKIFITLKVITLVVSFFLH